MTHKSSSVELLHEKVQNWIWKQGWTSLKEIQENTIPIVLKGDCDVIISAATAGGKTEAAFLPILSNLLSEDFGSSGYDVLYISPLKALINDQYRRLLDMTKGLNINVTPWHGDISISVKNKSVKNSSGILIITPESLESFFINRFSDVISVFSKLRYIVIDELHAFIGNERGKQLQSLLSRIELITGKTTPRIAMSATFSNYDSVKNFLRQDEVLECFIPYQGDSKHEIRLIIKNYLQEECTEKEICNEIFTKLRGANNLVFANSRLESELYAVLLRDMSDKQCVPNEFHVHHGNLSKIERKNIEKELQLGHTPITAICTSTLELGVDIGKVKSIAQIGVANSVSSLRQRLGRSGRRNEPSILRIFSVENSESKGILYELRTNLVQNIAVIELLREHKYESPNIDKFHLSTLIQQILSLLASYSGFYPKEGWFLLCNKGAFKNISPTLFLMLLKSLGKKNIISQLNNGQIVIGKEGEKLLRNLDFYTAFTVQDNFIVISLSDSKKLGEISVLPEIGDVIILAGRRWQVNNIDTKRHCVYVNLSISGGNVYFDINGTEIDGIITQKMKEIYTDNISYPYLDIKTNCRYELDVARRFFKENSMDKSPIIKYGDKTILLTWVGAKINRTISLIYKYVFGKIIAYNELMLFGITLENIQTILSHDKPTIEQLSTLVSRNHKIKQKYDYLLSDELLNLEYGNTYLDIENAWNLLTTIFNRDKIQHSI